MADPTPGRPSLSLPLAPADVAASPSRCLSLSLPRRRCLSLSLSLSLLIHPFSSRFLPSTASPTALESHRKIEIAVDLSDKSAFAVHWAVQNYFALATPSSTPMSAQLASSTALNGAPSISPSKIRPSRNPSRSSRMISMPSTPPRPPIWPSPPFPPASTVGCSWIWDARCLFDEIPQKGCDALDYDAGCVYTEWRAWVGVGEETLNLVVLVYGMVMARSKYDGMQMASGEKCPFVLTRDGYIGSQRYAATWTGDNLSNWENLHMSIPIAIQLVLKQLNLPPETQLSISDEKGDIDRARRLWKST